MSDKDPRDLKIASLEGALARERCKGLHNQWQFEEALGCARILLEALHGNVVCAAIADAGEICSSMFELLEKHRALFHMDKCRICDMPVPDYIPTFCCNGQDCGCMGRPLDPCICGDECWGVLINASTAGMTCDEYRKQLGIPKWNGDVYELYPRKREFGNVPPVFGGKSREGQGFVPPRKSEQPGATTYFSTRTGRVTGRCSCATVGTANLPGVSRGLSSQRKSSGYAE